MSDKWTTIDAYLQVNYSKKIGKGPHTRVYLGTFHEQTVAVKVFEVDELSEPQKKNLEVEIANISKLEDHPNILNCLHCAKADNTVFLVLQCASGDLYSLIEENIEKKQPLSEL